MSIYGSEKSNYKEYSIILTEILSKMKKRIKGRFITILVMVVIILLVNLGIITLHYNGYEESIKVEKDSFVYDYHPDTNYGTDEYLRVGNYHFGMFQTFYFFNISSLPDGWSEVKIYVTFDYGSAMVDIGANLTYESWDELTITWNNKPKASVYKGHILCDGFDFRIPLRRGDIINDGIGVCLYAIGGEADGHIRGNSREGVSSNTDIAWIEVQYVGIDPSLISAALMVLGIIAIITCIIIGGIVVSVKLYSKKQKHKKKIFPPIGAVNNNALGGNWGNTYRYRPREYVNLEKVINEYITLKLVNGRSFIYVKGRRFIQCIRLILNIPSYNVAMYDEIDSIDEAAKLYKTHIHQNRIIGGRMGAFGPNQNINITPEQEFWGHCSNIQAWCEHDYDTRILMSNISFPLLRELTKAGDPKARRVYKEEIALRLESGYPSVVQYLLNQGYINNFTPSEFKTIIESTELIKNLSSNRRMLSQFLISCSSKFPSLLGDILVQILKLPEWKSIVLSSFDPPERPHMLFLSRHLGLSPQHLFSIKTALEKLFREADEKFGEDIIDLINVIEKKLEEQKKTLPYSYGKDRYEAFRKRYLDGLFLKQNLEDEENQLFANKIIEKFNKIQSKCSYCGKNIPKGQDTCDWCGHKKDDDEGGFFPYPYIFKPPDGGGGSMKEIALSVKISA